MIAQHLALDHPDRVRSLVLCCTHAGRQRQGGRMPWRLLAGLALRPVLGPTRSFPVVAPLLYSDRTRGERRDRLQEDVEIRELDATPIATAPAQIAAIARHDTRGRLGELEMPVLVVHGDADRLVPPAAAEELAGLIPQARLEMIPGAGHVITTDAEEEAAEAIVGFLDEAESRSTAGSAPR
jgi:3-oxoadipate enol-lactonase